MSAQTFSAIAKQKGCKIVLFYYLRKNGMLIFFYDWLIIMIFIHIQKMPKDSWKYGDLWSVYKNKWKK